MAIRTAHVWGKTALCGMAAGALAALGAVVGAPARAAAADPLQALEHSCHAKTSPDGAKYRICAAKVPTFDGTPLDVTVTLPPKPRVTGPLPLVAFLHGFL